MKDEAQIPTRGEGEVFSVIFERVRGYFTDSERTKRLINAVLNVLKARVIAD